MTEAPVAPRIIWQPSTEYIADTTIADFADWVGKNRGVEVSAYPDMWRWSVQDLAAFWSAVWEYFELGDSEDYASVLTSGVMPDVDWFQGAHINFAEFVLRPRAEDSAVAVITVSEDGSRETTTWGELRRHVASIAWTLRSLGVSAEDVVVGYLPNITETLVACLATVSIGALWSGVGQDYAPQAAIDRFAQLEPTVLFAADGHCYNGKQRDRRADVVALRAGLPTLRHVIGVTRLGHGVENSIDFAEASSHDVAFEAVDTPFGHPLWVLFSSGTTGLPKGIVHSHGGILLEQAKLLGLNWDLKSSDRMTWYTSPSWVMWNCVLSALMRGGSVLCYDGAPLASGPSSLWRIVAENEVTIFGTSPGFLTASQDQGVSPAEEFDLSKLRIMGSTGAPLPERSFDYVSERVGAIPLFSMSGGTDIAGAFALGSPNMPVWAGELSVRGLGMLVESWSDRGESLVNHVGELVALEPMPSMPLRFWNDPDGSKYKAAYFEVFTGCWRHGDWITVTDRGSVIVHGRSDSTLNRNGVRMGSADIYSAIESMDEIAEALVIGAEEEDGGYWMPLFVVLNPGTDMDEELALTIKDRIRRLASPRHVPDEVLAVRAIPHTRTGKKLEVPIKRLIQGANLVDVLDPSVLDSPESIEPFRDIANARLARIRARLPAAQPATLHS